MYDKETITEQVVENLSRLIAMEMRAVGNEQRFPSSNPDKMDDIIKDGKHNIRILLKMREEFEILMSGYLI